MGVPATTPDELLDAIASSVELITPSTYRGQDVAWKHTGKNEALGAASLSGRLFWIEWAPADSIVEGGLTGNNDYETSILCVVVTSYRVFPEERVGGIVAMDHEDIAEQLNDSLDPVIRGLTWAESASFTRSDRGEQLIEHAYRLQYMAARSS